MQEQLIQPLSISIDVVRHCVLFGDDKLNCAFYDWCEDLGTKTTEAMNADVKRVPSF